MASCASWQENGIVPPTHSGWVSRYQPRSLTLCGSFDCPPLWPLHAPVVLVGSPTKAILRLCSEECEMAISHELSGARPETQDSATPSDQAISERDGFQALAEALKRSVAQIFGQGPYRHGNIGPDGDRRGVPDGVLSKKGTTEGCLCFRHLGNVNWSTNASATYVIRRMSYPR